MEHKGRLIYLLLSHWLRRHIGTIGLKHQFSQRHNFSGLPNWLGILETAGVPSGPINDVGQVLSDPQVNARNMVVSADDPVAGPLKMAGNPIKMSAFDDPSTRQPAPELDADRDRIIAEL